MRPAGHGQRGGDHVDRGGAHAPRVVELTVPCARTDGVVERLGAIDCVVSLRLLPGAWLQPPGDVVSFDVLDRSLPDVMRLADELGLGRAEEVALTMGRESTMTGPKLVVMLVSGLFAAAGLHTGALHLVIGAMLVAPAYEPVAHVAFGLVNDRRGVTGGFYDLAASYAALAAGAVLFSGLSVLFGSEPLADVADTYLASGTLVEYWTTIDWTSVVVGAAGGTAGGLLILTDRRVLATGVVIALALVPSLALAVMELVVGDPSLGGRRRAPLVPRRRARGGRVLGGVPHPTAQHGPLGGAGVASRRRRRSAAHLSRRQGPGGVVGGRDG